MHARSQYNTLKGEECNNNPIMKKQILVSGNDEQAILTLIKVDAVNLMPQAETQEEEALELMQNMNQGAMALMSDEHQPIAGHGNLNASTHRQLLLTMLGQISQMHARLGELYQNAEMTRQYMDHQHRMINCNIWRIASEPPRALHRAEKLRRGDATSGKSINEIRVVVNGAGASAQACTE